MASRPGVDNRSALPRGGFCSLYGRLEAIREKSSPPRFLVRGLVWPIVDGGLAGRE